MSQIWIIWLVAAGLWSPLLWYLIRQGRRASPKARIKRRMLVKEDGQLVWRTVRGRCLVGMSNSKQQVNWGLHADRTEWAVIQVARDKLVAYRFDQWSGDGPRTGVIQVCDSWHALEAAVPAPIFEEALLAAGVKKPDEYKEVPLKL